jgi:hypothetical protein
MAGTMKMPQFTFALLLLLMASACAPSTTMIRPRTLSPTALAQVEIGATPEVITRLFGAPDTTYVMVFGKEAGDEWQGVAWRYYTLRDTRYAHAVEFRRTIFYFYRNPAGELKLNHWVLDRPPQGAG